MLTLHWVRLKLTDHAAKAGGISPVLTFHGARLKLTDHAAEAGGISPVLTFHGARLKLTDHAAEAGGIFYSNPRLIGGKRIARRQTDT